MTQLPTPTCVCVQERVRELPPGALPGALHPSKYMEILHAKAKPLRQLEKVILSDINMSKNTYLNNEYYNALAHLCRKMR